MRISFAVAILALAACSRTTADVSDATRPSAGATLAADRVLYSEDFLNDSHLWISELENGGSVSIRDGRLDIDVPAGASIWFKPMLTGPILIQYDALVIKAGGPNDRVSDLNCFWMARDRRNPDDLFAVHRTGKFADYNLLFTYYVGLGGNGNTTTRFRRYIGDPAERPLLPAHDLRDAQDLITPNVSQTIQLVARGNTIEYYRDRRRIFRCDDSHPYTSGWFALRTTKNHMQVRRFRVFSLRAAPTTTRAGGGGP